MKEESRVLRWKWEFMRRNPEYRSDYEKMQARRQEMAYDFLKEQIEKDRLQREKDHPKDQNGFVGIIAIMNNLNLLVLHFRI